MLKKRVDRRHHDYRQEVKPFAEKQTEVVANFAVRP